MPDIFKVIGTSLLSLAVLFLLCRLNGQRQISQMSLFDYINSITIGSIAAELATDLENWQRTLTAMAVYGVAIALIGYLTCKSLGLRKLLNGTPLLLFENGDLYKANLLRAKLDVNEFLTQCRVVGYHDLSQLAAVVLETNGQLSFLPKAEQRPATPQDLGLTPPPASLWADLILDGKILTKNLAAAGREERWLRQQLSRCGIGQISEVFLAMCDRAGNFQAYRKQEEPVKKDLFE